MLHTKFRGDQSTGSRDFEGFGDHLGHVTSIMLINSFPSTQKYTYKMCLKMAQWFLRKASFNFHM